MNQRQIFTIGHSNHPVDHFIDLFKQHRVATLVDIRRYPSSRRLPQFNLAKLADSVAEHGIGYHWLESLGGRRERRLPDSESPNLGIKDESFRNYADYMLTEGFQKGVNELTVITDEQRTAIMCAEANFRHCHRRLVSDYLIANGFSIQHIMPTGDVETHSLSDRTQIKNGSVTYPEELPLFDGLGERGAMSRVSAGLLMYRIRNGTIEALLAHPGGPFFRNKDEAAWSIPKGEIEPDEDPLEAAQREFEEETGVKPSGPFRVLTTVKQKGGKVVHAWAFEGDCDPTTIVSNTFTIEWPPKSGQHMEFPEIDKAEFFDLDVARQKINSAQVSLIDELEQQLRGEV